MITPEIAKSWIEVGFSAIMLIMQARVMITQFQQGVRLEEVHVLANNNLTVAQELSKEKSATITAQATTIGQQTEALRAKSEETP